MAALHTCATRTEWVAPLISGARLSSRQSPVLSSKSRRCPCIAASASSSQDSPDQVSPSLKSVDRRALLLLAGSVASLPLVLSPGLALAEDGACEFKEGAGGLQYCDLVVGSGYQPAQGDLIKAHYTGRLLNGTVFDTSYKRGRPLSFRVGVGEVIRGWDLGILGEEGVPPMLAGGRRTLRIPATLAYGARGAGCRGGTCAIPPNSDLIFEVELVGKA